MPLNNKLLKIKLKFLWLFIAIGLVILVILLLFVFNPLTSNFPQYDILDIEFAWTTDKLETIFIYLGENGVQAHRLGVYWDFLFILGYVQFFSGIILLISTLLPTKFHKISGYCALLPIFAGLLDVLENSLLLYSLGSDLPIPQVIPLITGILAGIKFSFLGIGLVSIVIGSIIFTITKIQKKNLQ